MDKKKILIVEDEFIIADVLANILKSSGHDVCGIANSVKEAQEMIRETRPEFVMLDIYLKGKLTGIDLALHLTELDIPFIYISANSSQKVLDAAKMTNPYGFVVKPFRDRDVLTALDIAVYRNDNKLKHGSHQTALLQKMAAEILSSNQGWEMKMLLLGKAIQPYIPFEFLSFGITHEDVSEFYELGFSRIGYDEYQVIGVNELMIIFKKKLHELAALKAADPVDQMATWYDEGEINSHFPLHSLKKTYVDNYNLRSYLTWPISISAGRTAYLNFYSRRPDAYQANHMLLYNQLRDVIDRFIHKMLDSPESPLQSRSNNYTRKQSEDVAIQPNPFSGIIGNSHLLLNVFDQVSQVARADASVLLLGESGTGKEKIGERIHFLSLRKDKPFVRINCAALPATLIDSELFGHEKGAFTGAFERKIGKFEQAHTGTIFLDEIGELPLESQSKLLRVLQEREIERIGGRTTIKTDVRIIAATNRDLNKEVAEGRFRLDLFYRINVFPIVMPPLRERKEDIAELAYHFLRIYSRKIGKNVQAISPQVQENMQQYHWPGNIRELENLIERNVLLTRENMITNMVLPTQLENQPNIAAPESGIVTMIDGERAHIMAALKKCNGKIWGEGGAASLLKLPPTTLNSKMKKLGIRKDFGL